ncbi:hypothetical protein BDN70DRAFT_888652 [Pholiota conissans]|uniref:Uncharacterized protein n=1 Tax=Pholiota conissans TaxID=109636 RepID=A0A9P5YKQ9_9AGAR|nr:hypothetical protein BDN70DRAFT_888652 [Pholiota conissans]
MSSRQAGRQIGRLARTLRTNKMMRLVLMGEKEHHEKGHKQEKERIHSVERLNVDDNDERAHTDTDTDRCGVQADRVRLDS